jgi:arylsulfatase A-like enzyme
MINIKSQKMRKRIKVYLGLKWMIFIFIGFSACTGRTEKAQPNILFIMADDHTTQAISCYDGIFADKAKTVNIDRIAEEVMRFTNVLCTNSICSPSRATIPTGKYSHKNGLYCLGQSFNMSQQTTAGLLGAAGYQTAVYGKWHLRCTPEGFDDYKVLPVQGRYQDPQFHVKGEDSLVIYAGWSTDIIADMTMDFLRNRDKHKPFYVMCHFKATHDPWASRPPHDTLFINEEMPAPANLFDTYENREDPSRRTTLKLEFMNQSTYPHDRLEGVNDLAQRDHIYQQYIRDFFRCGRVLDENVGRVMDFIEEEGLDKNTIVFYTADQGHFLGENGFFSKRFMYEEAMRMPLIVRYPGKVEAGSVNDDLVINADFAPTIVDMAGIAVPEDLQGESILPLLEENTPDGWRRAVYYRYWQHLLHRDVTAHYGIRTKTHKLIYFYGLPLEMTNYPGVDPSWEFFDLANDPAEMNSLYHDPDQQALIKELKQTLLKLKEQYGDTDDKYHELVKVNEKYFW